MRKILLITLFLTLLGACSSKKPQVESGTTPLAPLAEAPNFMQSRNKPPIGYKGMVVSEDWDASEWGAQILRDGGNAIDAAVATALYLSVVRPYYASLGGGGFMVYCPAPIDGKSQACTTLDMRETAPAKATKDMYVINGKPKPELSDMGALAVATPGNVDGYLTALAKFGKTSRQKILSRPIQVAQKGYRFTGYQAARLAQFWKDFSPALQEIFTCGKDAGKALPCRAGDKIKQRDLAKVLSAISAKGRAGFYEGWVAEKIATALQKSGGVLSREDLKNYKAKERAPLIGQYHGVEIVTMPPPSGGGVVLLQLFAYLEEARQAGLLAGGMGSSSEVHALGTAMSLAFADALKRIGDPEFAKVPLEDLLKVEYLKNRWKQNFSATKWKNPAAGELPHQGVNTTHIDVIDKSGNAVSLTITVNGPYGSGVVAPGTGVVLNNEMNDFTVIADSANIRGVVSASANEIAPGKRPLSSMTPTIVRDAASGMPKIVIGGQGGPFIPTATFLTLVDRLVYGMSITDAISAPRFHHQWKPSVLQLEKNLFGIETIEALKAKGHEIKIIDFSARMHALERLPSGEVWGAADPRTEGSAVPE